MMIAERIQALVHKLDVAGVRWVNYLALTALVLALAVRYDFHCYRNFSSPEAMDAAQVARNLSEGKGFTTQYIRPFGIYLLQKHRHAVGLPQMGPNAADYAQVYGPHPDLANPPLYPVVLAGLFKLTSPAWQLEKRQSFWSGGGHFARYKPEFAIAIMNQLLLLTAVLLAFKLARAMFDTVVAWLSSLLLLYSEEMWKFSVSGLPTMLLIVIFLGLAWCLVSFESLERGESPHPRQRFILAASAGLLVALGMLTRYSFGWLIVPVVTFLVLFGGARRVGLAVMAVLVFGAVASPWLVRNFSVSGTLFGTAGYAVIENSEAFSGSRLMQSLNPEMFPAYQGIVHLVLLKLATNLRYIMANDVPQLGGGWIGILFLTGLLLGFRNVAARRLRYFMLMCLGVFIVAMALGVTSLSFLSPMLNNENLLVLLSPLAIIFGVAFFLTLLDQMAVPVPEVRYIIIGLMIFLVRLPLTLSLLPPGNSPLAYPPYYPPDIQRFSAWMQPDELVMSDVPWAVAWYGNRQSVLITLNCQYEFNQLNDFIKPVNALYLSLNTLDGKLVTECMQGGVENWSTFTFKTLAFNQLPAKFPLSNFPVETFGSGLFLSDRRRW